MLYYSSCQISERLKRDIPKYPESNYRSKNDLPVYQEVTLLTDADLTLIHEVLFNYDISHNHVLVSNAAEKIRKILAVSNGKLMSDVKFLQTIIEDYNHITSQIEV